jgi:hypothetical protein
VKTKTWSPGEQAVGLVASAAGPMDWISTPLVFVTLKTAPAEVEIISALYQVVRSMRQGIPFTLEMRSGELLVSFSKDEFFVAEEFKLPLQVFEKVMGLERTMAVQETLDTLQAKVDVLNAQREAEQFAAQQRYEEQVQTSPAVEESDAEAVSEDPDENEQAPSATTVRPSESSDSSADIRSMLSDSPARQSRAGTNRRRS